MEAPLNSAKDKLTNDQVLQNADGKGIQELVSFDPNQANGNLLDADFVEDDHEVKNVEYEKQLFAEADNYITSGRYDLALGRIEKLLASNAANPVRIIMIRYSKEALRKKAQCETKLERFVDAMTSLQMAADLDPKMKVRNFYNF
jgi:tetratricopeptide (TPR) repeat protein